MTFQFTNGQNLTPATWAVAIFNLKTQLVAQGGWVVRASSDGTTYNATGDQISTGSSGAGGLDNASAWFRVQAPDGLHEFTFQRNSATGANTSRSMRVKYSKAAHFTGGSPGATQTASATDEQILIGGGTDASPTYTQWQSASDNTYSQNIGVDSATPYGFYMFLVVTGSAFTTLGGNMIFEPIAVSTPTTDPDPYVVYWSQNGDTAGSNFAFTQSGGVNTLNSTTVHCAGYIGATFTLSIPVALPATGGSSLTAIAASCFQAQDPNATTKDFFRPLEFLRSTAVSAPNGWKGFSGNTLMFLSQAVSRNQLTLETVTTTGDHVSIGPNGTATTSGLAVPWNNVAING